MMAASARGRKVIAFAQGLRARITLSAAVGYAAGGATAYALKAFYSGANAEQLRWVLAPTCWLAGGLTGMTFIDEAGAGVISHADRLVVGAACSGLNFLIVCFATLFFSFARRWRGLGARLGWLVASLAVAYGATIATNAVRVVLAARLYHLDIYGDLLTAARLHRLMGTFLYCASLVTLFQIAQSRFVRPPSTTRWRVFETAGLPLGWYLAVALLVPLVRRPTRPFEGRLAEHVVTVVGTVVLVMGGTVIARTVANRIKSRQG